MNKSRFLSILIVPALVFAISGCSTSTANTPSPSANDTPSVNAPDTGANFESSAEPVTITFWHNYDEGAGQIDVLDSLIAQFESENQGIKVDPVYLEWAALKNNVVTGAATKMLPDVLRGDIGFVPQFQDLNVLVEMSALPGYADIAAKILEAPNSTAKMGDKYYGIAANTNTKILFYNKDLLDNAGITVPKTLDELWDAAAKLSGGGKYGFVEAWTGVWNVGQYIWSNGGDILSPDYSTAAGYLNGDTAVAAIQKLADLYRDKSFTGPTLDPGAMGDTDGWAAGVYAMEIDGPWRTTLCEQAGINFGAAPMPAGSAGSVGVLGGEDFMMFQTSDGAHQTAAWKFVQFMVSKDAQVAMAKAGQMPVNIDAISDPAALEAMPLLPVFAQTLQTARSRPVTPKWGDMEDIIATKVNEAITGVLPVKQALDEAVAAINEIINS